MGNLGFEIFPDVGKDLGSRTGKPTRIPRRHYRSLSAIMSLNLMIFGNFFLCALRHT